MIRNFDEVCKQLKELAPIINAFKSEVVQLRVVELVIGADHGAVEVEEEEKATSSHKGATKKKIAKRRSPKPKAEKKKVGSAPARSGRPGGSVTLSLLIESGFFKKPKTIGAIVEHCDVNLALKYSQSDFSGPLARQVRDKVLKRQKNGDNQYEYTNV